MKLFSTVLFALLATAFACSPTGCAKEKDAETIAIRNGAVEGKLKEILA